MAESLGELYLSLSLKTADLEAQLNQIKEKTQSTTDNMGSSFKSMLLPMAGIAGGMFGITKAFEFGSDSVKKYIEQAQGFAKVEAIIKSTGGAAGFTATELSGIADELSKINGIDDSEIMNGITANMLTFSNVSGQVFKDAQQSVLDMTAVMGGDLTGASIRLGKALNDPITGVTALQRVGVRLTDAQKEQVKAFMESGDIISAQNLILGELKKEFGGASEAANKASGGLKELSVNTEKLMEAIGGVIMFGLKPFIEVSNFVIGNISKLGQQANTTEDSMVKLRLDFESTAMGLLNLSGNTHKTAVEQEAYTKLIDDANTKYGQFLPKLITEKDSYNSIKTAISGARIELDKYIQSKITEAMVDSKLATLAPLKEKLINATTAEASLVHETKWTGGEQGLDKQNKEWNINRTKTVSDRINAENEYNKALSEVNKLIEEGNKIDAKNIVKLGEKLPLPVTEKEKKEYKNVIKLRTTYEEVFSSGGSIETEASKTAFATWEKAKNKYVQSVKNINTGGSDNKESEANQKKWDEQESNLKKWNLDNEKFDDAHLAKILENIETERKANIDNEHDLTETNKWAENEKKKAYKDNADYHKELEDKSFDDFKKEKDDELELMLSVELEVY